MKRYSAHEHVEPGIYFDPRHLVFKSMDEQGPLSGEGQESYLRVPALALLLIGPVIGLAYVIFLPLIGFVMLISLVARKLTALIGDLARSTVRVLQPSWQPARAFLSGGRARRTVQSSPDHWAEEVASILEEVPTDVGGSSTHLHKDVVIHAPLEQVLDLARDPRHWSDWYVGVSEPEALSPEGSNRPEYLTVGMRFPLAQPTREEHLSGGCVQWRARGEDCPECVRVGTCCDQLMLGGEQRWRYTASNGDTEVSVDMVYRVPLTVAGRAVDRSKVESLHAQTVERSLERLRMLCEGCGSQS